VLVSEVMTQAVVTANTGDSLRHVGELMRDRNVGSVVILEHERAVGVITDRDLDIIEVILRYRFSPTSENTMVASAPSPAPETCGAPGISKSRY